MRVHDVAAVLLLAAAFGCGGSEGGQESAEQAASPAMQAAPQAEMDMGAPTGEIDATLAGNGEGLFASKGCVACHTTTEQKLIGPGLHGVTARREYNWIVGMITNPDSMLASDAVAQQLLEENGTRMTPMGVSASEARAIYEYLRQHEM